jgi:hypothetical protein
MKNQPYLFIALLLLTASCADRHSTNQDADWIVLFNGENLDGWIIKAVPEDREYDFWSVEEGVIMVNSLGVPKHDYVWLMTEEEYGDFELRLQFQSYQESPGNSGVQIRSRYDPTGTVAGSKAVGWLDGPQVDIHPNGAWRTGYIYDETRGHQRWIVPSLPDWHMDSATYAPREFRHYFADDSPGWNDLTIICQGNHITTIVNGITIVDFDGTGLLDDEWHQKRDIDQKGHIALQLHRDDELKMAYRKIRLKEL